MRFINFTELLFVALLLVYSCVDNIDMSGVRFKCETDRDCNPGYICDKVKGCIRSLSEGDGIEDISVMDGTSEDILGGEGGDENKGEMPDVAAYDTLDVVEMLDISEDVGCLPNCVGKECGDDGCGRSCSECKDPPEDYCNGNYLVQYQQVGVCQSNFKCQYSTMEHYCQYGCDNGRCLKCTPNCEGKNCGQDGCGGVCGECAPGFVCTNGRCVCPDGNVCGSICCPYGKECISGRCCDSTWRSEFNNLFLKSVIRDVDGTLYLTGKYGYGLDIVDGNAVIVLAIDACGKEISRKVFYPDGAVRAQGNSIFIDEFYIYVGGIRAPSVSSGDVAAAFGSILEKSSYYIIDSISFDVSSANDTINDIGVTPDGMIWAVGYANSISKRPNNIHNIIVAKIDRFHGRWCVWDPYLPSGDTYDSGNGIVVNKDGRIYFTGQKDNKGVINSYNAGDCNLIAPCNCAPTGKEIILSMPNAIHTESFGLAFDSNSMYAGGRYYISEYTDGGGFVSKIQNDKVLKNQIFNPTSVFDGFLSIATDSSNVYAVGYSDWTGGLVNVKGTLVTYDNDLNQKSVIYPLQTNGCFDVTTDSNGGIILVCNNQSSAIVLRCKSSGVCP